MEELEIVSPEETQDAAIESRAMDPLLAAEMLSHRRKQESIVQVLSEKENLERLTQLKPGEQFTYAKADLLLDFWNAVEKMDKNAKGFEFPNMKQTLVNADLSYRKSVRAKIIDSIVRVSHVFERGDGNGSSPKPFGFRRR